VAATLFPPPVTPPSEKETPPSNNGNGFGGGNFDEPKDHPEGNPRPDPERWATPLSAYRTAALFVIFSIMSVFATLTHILESRWVHSKDWVSIPLPHILYLNTAVLLISSLTIELARVSRIGEAGKRSSRWLALTLLLGLVFVAGQLLAWRALVAHGLYVASNAGSFFFYFLTAAHAVHLLGGVLALSYVVLFSNRLARKGRQLTAIGAVVLYWHFMDGLWLYVLALLFVTIQR
jgi:cytochrome c oxidase subunit 3